MGTLFSYIYETHIKTRYIKFELCILLRYVNPLITSTLVCEGVLAIVQLMHSVLEYLLKQKV
jgi:hypothetical protein